MNVDKEYNSKGSGLGLSITKTLAELLNHEIGFSSKIGEGSIFYLIIKCINNNKNLNRNTTSFMNKNYISLSSREKDNDTSNLLDEINQINILPISYRSSIKRNSFENENNISTVRNNYNLHKSVYFPKQIYTEEINSFGFSINNNYFDDNLMRIIVIDDNKFIRESQK